MTKQFHLGDLLSVITGQVISNRNMEGIYDILAFMTGQEGCGADYLTTANQECRVVLLKQFPQLQNVDYSELQARIFLLPSPADDSKDAREAHRVAGQEICNRWLVDQAKMLGEWFYITATAESREEPPPPPKPPQPVIDATDDDFDLTDPFA